MIISLGERTPGEHFQHCVANADMSEQVKNDLRSLIADWVSKKIAEDIQPTMEGFFNEFPCFDHRGMYDDLIEAAIKRVKEMAS